MRIILIGILLFTSLSTLAYAKQRDIYLVKTYSDSESKKISKTTIFKSSNEAQFLSFLTSLEPFVIYQTLDNEIPIPTHLSKIVQSTFFPTANLLKNFENTLDQQTRPLLFVLHAPQNAEEKKTLRKHQKWINSFYRKHPEKKILIMKIKQKTTFSKPLHVFKWLPSLSRFTKDYSFCLTASDSRSSSSEHAFSYL
jgi:hypothetical protein